MAFGVTLAGFVTKRLSDIVDETKTKWLEEFGDSFDLDPRTPEGQIKGILDERESKLWELAEDVYNSGTVAFSEGVSLDNLVALTGQTREGNQKTLVDKGRAFGVFGTSIPVGTVISKAGDSTARFVTDAISLISIVAIDEVQKVSFDADPDSGKFNIVFPEGTTADIAHDASLPAIQAILDTTLGVGNSVVTGSIDATGLTITFGGALGGLPRAELTISGVTLLIVATPVVVTPSTTTEGSKATSPIITLTAENAGAIAVPAGTLTVIETPVIGLEDFTNEEDAIVGRAVEEDPDLKLRRSQELQIAGSATIEAIRSDLLDLAGVTAALVFQNNTDVTDSDGRPPHTLDIVVEGSTDQAIIDRIFSTIAGGIGTIGDISGVHIDSQGFSTTLNFSRPTSVPIFVEVDLTTDGDFPTDGVDQVEAAILAYGNLLTIGKDIIVFGSDPLSCSFRDIPGITDFEIRVSRDAGPPTVNDNITIAPRENSDFDSSRITAVEL